ncbi:putative membrane protein [Halioglobus japonicus]|nr:putative membrane protein [Halioglobus japonicus]
MTEPTPLQRLWLTEAVRLREEQAGPLDDVEANRLARTKGGDLRTRLQNRAVWLAQRDGLLDALGHWLQGARLALFALIVFAVFSGAGLAFTALGNGQNPVNVFWALGSLLGLNLLLLLGWMLGLIFTGEQNANLGRLWMWLSEKLARDAKAAQLAPALLLLLQRHHLNRWAIGIVTHSIWLLALVSALIFMLMLMATRRYGFVWETTILSSDTFVIFTQALGAFPSWLGLNVPTPEMIRASGDAALNIENARQAWAAWMVGVLLTYGIAPRLLLALVCLWRWRVGRRTLELDLNLPGYAQLREQLMPSSERLGVNDAAPNQLPDTQVGVADQTGTGAMLVAIELDDEQPWPPALPAAVTDAGILDSRESRQNLLEQMSRFPPERLAIACDPRRSPDRGSLGLIAELARNAAATRIWLLQAPPNQTLDSDRLGDWHTALLQLGIPVADCAPLNWLENGSE